MSDLLAGLVDLYFGNASVLLPYANNDKIRLIAVGTAQRLPVAPDIPTVAETLPGFEFSSWNGFLAPSKTRSQLRGFDLPTKSASQRFHVGLFDCCFSDEV